MKIILHSVMPFLFGIGIYYLGRDWNNLQASKLFQSTQQNPMCLPSWIKYNLPDGLWHYSFTYMNLYIWNFNISKNSIFWILLIPFIAYFTEYLQYLKYIDGTYDFKDLLAYSISCLIVFTHINFLTTKF